MELNAYFKSLVDQDRAAVVICDLEHTIIYMNPAAIASYAKHGGAALLGLGDGVGADHRGLGGLDESHVGGADDQQGGKSLLEAHDCCSLGGWYGMGLDRPITGGRLQAARCNTALSEAGRVGPHFFVGVSSVLPSGSWLSR
mgnify:CR=1 FL=1